MPEFYGLIKHVHMSSALLSVALFFMRGSWMIFHPERLQWLWARVVPHVINTVLLLSALVLVVMLAQHSLPWGWLAAKLTGLVAYVGLGVVAMRRGPRLHTRVAAFAGALLAFAFVIVVAVGGPVSP